MKADIVHRLLHAASQNEPELAKLLTEAASEIQWHRGCAEQQKNEIYWLVNRPPSLY